MYFNPSNYTYKELSRIREQQGQQELSDAYGKLSDLEEEKRELEKAWDGENSSRDEESEFRRVLIQDMQTVLERQSPRYTETKELIKSLLEMIQESYVEL